MFTPIEEQTYGGAKLAPIEELEMLLRSKTSVDGEISAPRSSEGFVASANLYNKNIKG